MTRENKFRGLSEDTGKWVYGYVAYDSKKENAVIIHKQGNNEMQHTAVIPESVGEYSGLNDKNELEIYEADIVSVGYGIGKVVFYNAMFMIEWIDDKEANMEPLAFSTNDYKFGRGRKDLEKRGNIHENPELIIIS